MARLLRPILIVLASLAGGVVLPAAEAGAHPMAPALLEIVETGAGTADVKWKTPANQVPGARMVPKLPAHCAANGEANERAAGTAVVRTWTVDCSKPLPGSDIEVHGIAASKADVVVRLALADGRVFNTVLTSDNAVFRVPEQARAVDVVRSYLELGFEHILTGADHLVFVLGLMLLVSTGRALVLTVTAFTVGHSITLSLAVLGVVAIPSAPVEALIALSILLVAVELARAPDRHRTVMRRFPWMMAFAFGLLHGFGFAGALSEVGLPANEIPLALLSFNLGIEAGQLTFCAVALALYGLVRSLGGGHELVRLSRSRVAAAYVIGTLASFWLIDRAIRVSVTGAGIL